MISEGNSELSGTGRLTSGMAEAWRARWANLFATGPRRFLGWTDEPAYALLFVYFRFDHSRRWPRIRRRARPGDGTQGFAKKCSHACRW